MGKAKAPRRLADNEARAVLRTIRISPQKLNLVAALIRGKKVATALSDLEFSAKRISGTVKKTLESAIANAENNHDLKPESLRVVEAVAGKAKTFKSFRPKARGSAGPLLMRGSHIRIVVANDEGEESES